MRIVVDLQGGQSTGSRNRGIGRYSLALVQAMARARGAHDIVIALSDLFPDTIESIRAMFAGLLPAENVRVWDAVPNVAGKDATNNARRHVAERVREAFLSSLEPDIVLNTSLFEGLEDDAVTSIGLFDGNLPTAVVLYDLIPLIHQHVYLQNPIVETWYQNKLDQLRRADLLLSISASSGKEAVEYLGFPADSVVNISTACDSQFAPQVVDAGKRAYIAKKFGLRKSFVMYTGGNDWRKNVDGLFKAYASLPKKVRADHQLAIVCSTFPALLVKWRQEAEQAGLAPDEFVITGFVDDADLALLYSACKLFVFPSWHEGFGLPALEAMACGRAVIGANTSSVPEVIGREDALFDPFDVDAIGRKMQEVLENDSYRRALEAHSLKQSKAFSWEASAGRALRALEELVEKRSVARSAQVLRASPRRPRLAYFSPLPPEQSGISDYSAELLPELARHYEIEVVVAQAEVANGWVRSNAPVRDVAWFRRHAHTFDRVMYHFGNSEFHSHMFDLLEEFPGIVVLHDFFLSGIVAFLDGKGIKPHGWARSLVRAHGWAALQSRYLSPDPSEVVYAYPCNLEVINQALGVIVHSASSARMADSWYGAGASRDWSVIPLLRAPSVKSDKLIARSNFGFVADDFVVCSFGHLGPTKLNRRLLNAWLASPMARDPKCHLVFVGQNNCGEYGIELASAISEGMTAGRVEITGWNDAADYQKWLVAADVGVQLRTLSRGETSAAVLDCMNYGLATVVNANGSMADLTDDAVWMMSDEFGDADLTDALTTLWRDTAKRAALSERGRHLIRTRHDPRRCAQEYTEVIERYYHKASNGLPALLDSLGEVVDKLPSDEFARLAVALSNNTTASPRRKQLLLDISELVLRDAKTGIQRVVRSILVQLLQHPPEGFVIEPVYASADAPGYRYARRFTSRFMGVWEGWAEDDPVDVSMGDVFLGLEWQPAVAVPAQKEQLLGWQRRGVKVRFVVYDLLPVLLPHVFPDESQGMHQRWLETISLFDGALCISRAVADEMYEWLCVYGPKREVPFHLTWFHLGADVEASVPTTGLPINAGDVLAALRTRRTFLMVGTVEPRKGYLQTLAAFAQLWKRGIDVCLVIVGQEGWKSLPDEKRRTIPETVRQLREHPELGKRLFWLEGVSDEYLEALYSASTCLIAASEGEGFGLPLIEAAQHELPVIARDIPVFREVAGDHAFYFAGETGEQLATSIEQWIKLDEAGHAPRSSTMTWLTWMQSANDVLNACLFGDSHRQWQRGDKQSYWGGDARLGSQVGRRGVREAFTDGRDGYLLFGPYVALEAGRYRVSIRGSVGGRGLGGAHMDAVCKGGNTQLGAVPLTIPDELGNLAVLSVDLDVSCSDLEVRVWVSGRSELSVSMIEIVPESVETSERAKSTSGVAAQYADATSEPQDFGAMSTLVAKSAAKRETDALSRMSGNTVAHVQAGSRARGGVSDQITDDREPALAIGERRLPVARKEAVRTATRASVPAGSGISGAPGGYNRAGKQKRRR